MTHDAIITISTCQLESLLCTRRVNESLEGFGQRDIRWVQIDMCQLLDQSFSQLQNILSDGNWFDFKDGKWYANSDLNKAPDIIRIFHNENVSFSRSALPIAFPLFFPSYPSIWEIFSSWVMLRTIRFSCWFQLQTLWTSQIRNKFQFRTVI